MHYCIVSPYSERAGIASRRQYTSIRVQVQIQSTCIRYFSPSLHEKAETSRCVCAWDQFLSRRGPVPEQIYQPVISTPLHTACKDLVRWHQYILTKQGPQSVSAVRISATDALSFCRAKKPLPLCRESILHEAVSALLLYASTARLTHMPARTSSESSAMALPGFSSSTHLLRLQKLLQMLCNSPASGEPTLLVCQPVLDEPMCWWYTCVIVDRRSTRKLRVSRGIGSGKVRTANAGQLYCVDMDR